MKQQLARRISLVMALALTLLNLIPHESVSARPVPPVTKVYSNTPSATTVPEEIVYPDCSVAPLKAIGHAPYEVEFYASGASSYGWWTADVSTDNTGAGETWKHMFLNEGEYKVRLTCHDTNGNYNHVTTWVTVLAPIASSTPEVPSPVVTPTATGSSLNIESKSLQDGCSETTIKQSDQNSGPVVIICGDMNGDLVLNPVATPTPPTESEEPTSTTWWQRLGLELMELIKAVFYLE